MEQLENEEMKADDLPSNHEALSSSSVIGNPFFDPCPSKTEEKKEEPELDIEKLIGKRNHQKILSSPNIVLSKKKVNADANAARLKLHRFVSQDILQVNLDTVSKSGTATPIIDQFKPVKPFALVSASENPVEITRQSEIKVQKTNTPETKEVSENSKPHAIDYSLPKGKEACCDLNGDNKVINCQCIIF